MPAVAATDGKGLSPEAEKKEADAKPRASSTVCRGQWSNDPNDYNLKEIIGYGATATVQAAVYLPREEMLAIKRIDLEKVGASIDEMQREIQTMSRMNHENVVNYYTSFIVKHELWIIMKLLDGGAVLDIIKNLQKKYKINPLEGILPEDVIAAVLKEVLKGLQYFHKNGQIHRDVKAGNILLGLDGTVQLADFGVSSAMFDYSDRGKAGKMRKTFVGTPCWMAPEVMEQLYGYNHKADIWSFGITAIELATGSAPYSKYPAMKVLMMTLNNEPPTLETCADGNKDAYKKYSKVFRKMIQACLQRDPLLRPDATELLKNPFFKKTKGKEYLKANLLNLAPTLGERVQKVRRPVPTSGRLHRTPDGNWEWSDDESDDKSNTTQEENTAAAPTNQEEATAGQAVDSAEQTQAAPTQPSSSESTESANTASTATTTSNTAPVADGPKVFDLTLRLRNTNHELNDIRFEFNTKTDTVDGVSQELMSAGLIDGLDLVVVAANLNKMITGPPPDKNQLCFSLKSYPKSSNEPADDERLIGFAMLTLNDIQT